MYIHKHRHTPGCVTQMHAKDWFGCTSRLYEATDDGSFQEDGHCITLSTATMDDDNESNHMKTIHGSKTATNTSSADGRVLVASTSKYEASSGGFGYCPTPCEGNLSLSPPETGAEQNERALGPHALVVSQLGKSKQPAF